MRSSAIFIPITFRSDAKLVNDLIFKEECFVVVGLCMKIHSKLGKGFREVVYKDALEIELGKSKIIYEREKPFKVLYDEYILRHTFNADFLVYNSIILEIKATSKVYPDNFKQQLIISKHHK